MNLGVQITRVYKALQNNFQCLIILIKLIKFWFIDRIYSKAQKTNKKSKNEKVAEESNTISI